MIFVHMGNNELLTILSERDVSLIRGGRTVFVDQKQLKGKQFRGIHIAWNQTDEQSLEMVKRSPGSTKIVNLNSPIRAKPLDDEEVCEGCTAQVKTGLLLDGRCICCWKAEAMRAKRTNN